MNKIKILVYLQFFLNCALVQVFAQQNKDMHIYILMGQSNMAGRGQVTEQYAIQQHPRVRMLNQAGEWVTAVHPLHFDKPSIAGVGPGLTFGITMAEANPDITIGLVPCAVGGTSIATWVPGIYDKATHTHPFDDAEQRIRKAMETGNVKGIIWHQGEGDSNEKSAEVYLDNLQKLIQSVRVLVGDPELPFVAGQLARYRDNYQLINKELDKLEAVVPHAAVVSSEGLWHKGDGTHFDSPSASELGRRFAEGMLSLQHNYLTEKEKSAGWELLFDGRDPNIRWRSISSDRFPKKGWIVEAGTLVLLPGRKGKDIITREQFTDFELVIDYKLADSANTGIKYFVSELKTVEGKTALNGPEFQLIDDSKHETVRDGKSPETSTGSLYLLYAPKNKVLHEPGKWNQAKIVAKGKSVEHWLNGRKVLSYERGSKEFKKLVGQTKFREYKSYGEASSGYILLQDHHDKAYFRNIKIRRLDGK
ncbi:MAG TPA: sialate O-acetylesterase [Sphingobacterium sp.]|nr:sialate O-acetylesterase [Sphingobacterium sp.]